MNGALPVLLLHRGVAHVRLAQHDEMARLLERVGQHRTPGVRKGEVPAVVGMVLELGDPDAETQAAGRRIDGGGGRGNGGVGTSCGGVRRHQVHPPLHHPVGFGEKAVAADVHPVALVANRARDAADLVARLENHGNNVRTPEELQSRRQPGRPRPDDDCLSCHSDPRLPCAPASSPARLLLRVDFCSLANPGNVVRPVISPFDHRIRDRTSGWIWSVSRVDNRRCEQGIAGDRGRLGGSRGSGDRSIPASVASRERQPGTSVVDRGWTRDAN